jgi:hypothetical protein
MTNATVVRYTAKPETADENTRLIRSVFAELADTAPAGLHYATFRLDDGVSFLHVAVVDGDENPLTTSPAFAEFQSEINSRLIEGPTASKATLIASYGMEPLPSVT